MSAQNTGRGWVLNGDFSMAGNAQTDGFSLISPLQPAGESGGWVVLRSEEDGLHVLPNSISPKIQQASTARIKVQNVFFREDEWLGDMTLLNAVSPVRNALGVIYEALLNQVEPL